MRRLDGGRRGHAQPRTAAGTGPCSGGLSQHWQQTVSASDRSDRMWLSAAEVEFFMACFDEAPGYRAAMWRAGCCDGAAPIGAYPKHILAAVAEGVCSWLMRHSVRGAELHVAA